MVVAISTTDHTPRGVIQQQVPTELLAPPSDLLRVGPPTRMITACDEVNRAALKGRVFWLYPSQDDPDYTCLTDSYGRPLEWLFDVRVRAIEVITRAADDDSWQQEKLNVRLESQQFSFTLTCSIDSVFCRQFIQGAAALLDPEQSPQGVASPFHLRATHGKKVTDAQFKSDRPLPYYANLKIPGAKNANWLDDYYCDSDIKDRWDESTRLRRSAKGDKLALAQIAHDDSLLIRQEVDKLQAAIDQLDGVIDAE